KRLEPTVDSAFGQHGPCADRLVPSFKEVRTEAMRLEQFAGEAAGSLVDDNCSRVSEGLKTCCQVWWIAHHRHLQRGTRADCVTNYHKTSSDSDPSAQRTGRTRERVQIMNGLDHDQAAVDCPLRVILMRLRISEIGKYPVTKVARDEAAEPNNKAGDRTMERRNHGSEVLRGQP